MTSYHGGKQRLGKQLAEIIVDTSLDIAEEEDFDIVGYCEPFCGMLGVYRHIPEFFEEESYDNLTYLAGDGNGSVIKMWKAAQNGWKPPTICSEKTYNKLKNSPDSALKGFIGHQCSFGGQWFKGFAQKWDKTKNPKKSSERVKNIALNLSDVKFKKKDYNYFSSLKNFVIYCDPPYCDTYCRYNNNNFDSKKFWDWCKDMSKDNIVFISEYQKPRNIKGSVIYSNSSFRKISLGKSCTGKEKLFVM